MLNTVFTMKHRMQCREKGRTSHPQGEKTAEQERKKEGKQNKSREKKAADHLEVKAGMWSGSGETLVCSKETS